MQWYLAYILLLTVQAAVFRDGRRLPRKIGDGFQYVNKSGTHIFLTLACVELILLAGLRGYTVGADTDTYLKAVRWYAGISFVEVFTEPLVWPFDFETGYFLLTKFCCWLNMSETAFLFVVAVLIYVPQFQYIYRNSSHPYISVLVYFAFSFFTYSLGIYRQFIAIGMVLPALRLIEKKRFFPYLLVILIAMQFHRTAFIALPLYFLPYFRWRRMVVFFLLLAVEVVLLVFGRYVIELAVSLFPTYAGYIGGRFDVQGGTYLNLIFLNLVYFLFCFANRDTGIKDSKRDMIAAQLAVAILLQCCAYHMGIFGRIVPYYSVALLVAIPNIVDGLSRKDPARGWLFRLGTCAVLVFLIIRELSGNSYVCPYYFFWE